MVAKSMPERPPATQEQIALAREQYFEEGEIEIDNDAVISVIDDRRYWVQAWVYVDERWPHIEGEGDDDPSRH